MITHTQEVLDTFYDIHEIPARHMIPATISIPLVNKIYELVTDQERTQDTINAVHSDLVSIFGKFDVVDAGRMVYEIARKMGYERSDRTPSYTSRWITSKEANHRRKMEALSARRAAEEAWRIRAGVHV